MNVYLGQHTVSDMLGPCEDGFHVPLKTEWKAILDAGISLGAWTSSGGSNFGRYLKLPMAGYRNGNSVDNIGSYGQYWGADIFGGSVDTITNLYFNSSSITNGYSTPKFGNPIRPIKDYPVTPTSGWTTIVGTLGSSGIFWNQTDGLISISSNGSTWYTISDKNVGATTVWNYGDALTEANCGSTFQRGNNYAFPSTKSTASVTTSSTQVDVTGYGPGNYYSSSTWITASTWQSSSNKNLRGGQTKGTWLKDTMLKNAYIGEYVLPYLCFTANTAGSTVQLTKTGSPTAVTLETSTDGSTWSSYTFGNTITLSNIGDKVYWRNTSESDTGFTIDNSNRYTFVMTGSIAGSGDINYLLNKNSTTTLSRNCYRMLFYNCTSLTTAPSLPATTLANQCYNRMFYGCTGLTTAPALPATTLAVMCYYYMFYGCTNLTTLPKLPATTLTDSCYYYMFYNCSKIKLSTSKTGEYQTAYRIPTTGTGTTAFDALFGMFSSTGGTFKSTPSINTTYYTSNTVV